MTANEVLEALKLIINYNINCSVVSWCKNADEYNNAIDNVSNGGYLSEEVFSLVKKAVEMFFE